MNPDNQPLKLTLEWVKGRSLERKKGGMSEAWLGLFSPLSVWTEHMGSICLLFGVRLCGVCVL